MSAADIVDSWWGSAWVLWQIGDGILPRPGTHWQREPRPQGRRAPKITVTIGLAREVACSCQQTSFPSRSLLGEGGKQKPTQHWV